MKKLLAIAIVLIVSFLPLQAQDTLWSKDFHGTPHSVHAVKFSPDGQYVFAGMNKRIFKYETETGDSVLMFEGHPDNPTYGILSLDFTENGDTLLSSACDGLIKLWNANTGDLLKTINLNYLGLDPFSPLAPEARFMANSNYIVISTSVLDSNNLLIWDLAQDTIVENIGEEKNICRMEISTDRRYLATGDGINPYKIKLWDLYTFQPFAELGSHYHISDLAFSPDGKLLASSGDDGAVKVWDIENQKLDTALYYGTGVDVWSVVFSPDSNYLIAGGGYFEHRTIKVFSLNDYSLVYTYPNPYGTLSLDISSDSKYIVSGGSYYLFLLKPI